MTLITLSASYGAGGSHVGPELARRLGVPFVDRAIPLEVAKRLHVTADEAAAHEEGAGGGWLERVLRGFIGTDPGAPAPLPAAEVFSSEDFRRATEEVILRQAATGQGVILGRGAMVVLRDDPRVLRVRLDGPADRRAARAAEHEGISLEEARARLERNDRARETYVKRFYGVDPHDPALYHVILDSTAIPLDACVEVILAAAAALPAPV